MRNSEWKNFRNSYEIFWKEFANSGRVPENKLEFLIFCNKPRNLYFKIIFQCFLILICSNSLSVTICSIIFLKYWLTYISMIIYRQVMKIIFIIFLYVHIFFNLICLKLKFKFNFWQICQNFKNFLLLFSIYYYVYVIIHNKKFCIFNNTILIL